MKHLYRFIGQKIDEQYWKISEENEVTHLSKVLRLSEGDPVEVTDGCGGWIEGTVATIQKKSVIVKTTQSNFENPPTQKLIIGVAALKHGDIDDLISPMTQIGVDELHVFTQDKGEKSRITDKAVERWSRQICSSIKQCKRSWVPKIKVHSNINEFLGSTACHAKNKIVFEPTGTQTVLEINLLKSDICALVGSEIGFSDPELKLLEDNGFVKTTLGSNVLRASTAIICGATVLALRRASL